jgi:hypothetical protein
MVAHVPRDLTFEVAARLRCYAELYGLPVNDGSVRYQAIYQVARTRDAASDVRRDSLANAQTYSFLRELPAAPNAPLVESLDISPENLAPGTYLLRLDITDAADGHRIGRAQVAFTIRSVER